MTKEYIVISHKYLEDSAKELNKRGNEGWAIVAYTQEFASTKILLEREKPVCQ